MIALWNRVSATVTGAALLLAPAPATASAASTALPSTVTSAPAALADPVCEVTYSVRTWSRIAVADVTITNTGGEAINGWSLAFALPADQEIIQAWGATYQPSTGPVTASDIGTNAYVDIGNAVQITFFILHNGSVTTPKAFSVNGSECTAVVPALAG